MFKSAWANKRGLSPVTMAIGLVGRKVGMTRIFTEDGVSIPVTVIEVRPQTALLS